MLPVAVQDEGLSLTDATRIAETYLAEMKRLGTPQVTAGIYADGIRKLLASVKLGGRVDHRAIRAWSDDLYRRFRPRSAAVYGVGVRRMLQWAADNGEWSFA